MGFPYVGDNTFDFSSKKSIFCPKKSKFGPKMAFLFILGQALPAHLVGARAVSRKTPIYFMQFEYHLRICSNKISGYVFSIPTDMAKA